MDWEQSLMTLDPSPFPVGLPPHTSANMLVYVMEHSGRQD